MSALLESAEIDTVPEFPGADASETKQRILTLRSPDELLAMQFDDSDVILGDRLLAKGQPLVIAAQGGTGKSRLALQIVASIVTGRKCLAFDTGGSEMRWLILQTENSNRRLQQDLARIKTWLGDDWPRFAEQVVFHTLENDDDGFVSLDAPDNQLAIQRAIETATPGGILVDPLNDFAAGDLNKDADMKATLQTLSRLCRRGNPQRAIIVLHHSLTGKAGAVRATGYDRASFARNSKTLHAWTRGQINLAPVDADNNDRLIVACGKCSNGKEFPAFGVRLNFEMIYECDPTIDVSAWQSEMNGKTESADLSPDMVAGIVAELGKASGAPKKPAIVKALRAETGCVTGSAYRAIERAENAKKIHYTKATKTYVTK
ncbi:MAG TPA: AAA family ATPase [Verrucomicrobiae bacterium]